MNSNELIAVLAVVSVIGFGFVLWAATSMRDTQLKTQASVAKAQEMTKRAEGRHEILDLLGRLKKQSDR